VVELAKRLLFLTGNPGVGKTTVLLRIVEALKAEGYRIGGMLSQEVRTGGERVGFEILDLNNGKRGWLAQVNQKNGPRIGRYCVNLEDLENIGAKAIMDAVKDSDVVAVDELGPMELFSDKFKEAVRGAVESKKLVVGVVHWRARDSLIDAVKKREDAETFVVTFENRDKLHELVIKKALEPLEHV
jgi:nucleoside-triphosphatase